MKNNGIYVFEGIDGSGKTTQFNMFVDWLESQGKKVKTLKFPRHSTPFFGNVVDDYLNDKFGPADSIHPKLASVLYAADRWETKEQLNKWLEQGYWVVLDRYATANMGHQVGKIKNESERLEMLNWLEELEYNVFKILRPTKVFWLDVPVEQSLNLMSHREGKVEIDGDLDGHENKEHLTNAYSAYKLVASNQTEWSRIDCMEADKLLSPEEIHKKIQDLV